MKFNFDNTTSKPELHITGKLQAQRLGEEFSLVIWDDCKVFYSFDAGKTPLFNWNCHTFKISSVRIFFLQIYCTLSKIKCSEFN